MTVFKRQTTGSVVCMSCRSLVGVNDERCYNCGRRNPGLWGFAPLVRSLGNDLGFVPAILVGSVGLYVVSLLMSGPQIFQPRGLFSFLSPAPVTLLLLGASGSIPVFELGRWWTVLSAGWLHAGLLHILFNMMWVRQLAPATADLYGAGRLVIIYTVSGVAGFALSSFGGAYVPLPILGGAKFTVGASAPIFGLLGALVCYGRVTGSRVIHGQAVSYALLLFVFGLIMPGVDNYAHAGGFLGGYAVARLMNPLAAERLDHLVVALACLGASILAVVASVALGIPLLLGR
jgi:rhomboid protease GluP